LGLGKYALIEDFLKEKEKTTAIKPVAIPAAIKKANIKEYKKSGKLKNFFPAISKKSCLN
jgi:hypothetical protein